MPWAPRPARPKQRPRDTRKHDKKTSDRGYGWDWQKLVAMLKRERPLCEDCLENGMVSVSKEGHHITKIKHDVEKRLDPDNVRMLCEACHRIRTAKGE
jgi:5-methylcytosine-specific restriction endonuclease McrA